MGPLVGSTELPKALIDAGNNLLKLPSSTDAILTLLDETESLLANVEQDPTASVQKALMPSMKALVSADLLRNPDSDVRVSVISCLTEVMRITAPEAPYNDDQMKEIFQVTIEAFGKLADVSSRSYRKAEVVLETVSKVRSSLVMLDLECDDLILEMFRQFLKIISPDHPQGVLLAMETIMTTVIDESEEAPMDLFEILLTAVKKESQDVSPMALSLAEKVLSSCADTLQPCIMEALKSSGTSLDMYSPVILSISSVRPSESATTQANSSDNAKENEAVEKVLEKQVVPSDSLEDKFDLGLSCKGNRSKRTARVGTPQANGDDKIRSTDDFIQRFKQGQSESTDTETESGSTKKRGRKPNSLMNPEEGYSFKMSSSKKEQEKELGDSPGKLAVRKESLPAKAGQTKQSVVISLSSSSRARSGSRKRSRFKMEETDHDVGSTPTAKKQMVKKGNPEEEDFMDSKVEKPEDDIKTAQPSKKGRAKNGLAKTSAKKETLKSDNPEEEDLMESKLEKPESGINTAQSSKKERANNGLAKTSAKKQIVKKDNSEEDLMESEVEKPEDGVKTARSSKKERAKNGLVKTSAKKETLKNDNSEEEDLMESKLENPEDGIKTAKSSKKERAQNGLTKTSAKKQIVKKDNSEDLMESEVEKPEDGIKTAKSSKKKRAQSSLAETSTKKPLAETKIVKTSEKKSVNSDAKKKSSEGASTDTPIPQSSKSKKKNSRATTSSKKSEHTPQSHPKRKRTPVEKVESSTNELGEELVGKRVNVWWPLDKRSYEGVIVSYNSDKKRHIVSYHDGDTEELNLKEERFEIIQDNSSANEDKEIDLPESIPLSAFIKSKKGKTSKKVSMNVELSSSPEVRSPVPTMKKNDSVTVSTKQVKRTKGALKAVSNELESSAGKDLKSLGKVNDEPGGTKGRTGKKQATLATHRKSEKDCNVKEGPETKCQDNMKLGKESNGEPDCKEEPNAEPRTEGEEQEAAKEPTDEEEHRVAKERNAEPEADEEEQKSLEEANAEPKTEGEERMSVKEPSAEPETKVEEKESAGDAKLMEKVDMPGAKGEEIDKEAYTSMSETGKVVNEAEEDDQRVIEELKEESKVGTKPG